MNKQAIKVNEANKASKQTKQTEQNRTLFISILKKEKKEKKPIHKCPRFEGCTVKDAYGQHLLDVS